MHVHLGFIHGFVVLLYFLAFVGVLKILALRYQGHPLADAFLEVY